MLYLNYSIFCPKILVIFFFKLDIFSLSEVLYEYY